MILILAGLGAVLAYFAHVTQLDGYLATTPGGFSEVVRAVVFGGRPVSKS